MFTPVSYTHLNSETVAIEGNAQVEALRLRQTKTGEEKRLDVDGVFIAVGIAPESELYAGCLLYTSRCV